MPEKVAQASGCVEVYKLANLRAGDTVLITFETIADAHRYLKSNETIGQDRRDGLMTLRIERVSEGSSTTIRLIGCIRAEQLGELKAQIQDSQSIMKLDLEEVSLVDVDVVRFLGTCQEKGISLIHCSPYILDWITKERSR
jgi:hypothetical protein